MVDHIGFQLTEKICLMLKNMLANISYSGEVNSNIAVPSYCKMVLSSMKDFSRFPNLPSWKHSTSPFSRGDLLGFLNWPCSLQKC